MVSFPLHDVSIDGNGGLTRHSNKVSIKKGSRNKSVLIKYISFDMNISYNSTFSKNAPKTSLLSTWVEHFHLRGNFKFHCNFVELKHNSDI